MKRKLLEWKDFKATYVKLFGVEPILVDYIAVWDILVLCAGGRSNSTISNFLGEGLDYILEVVKEFLGFEGYSFDLDINTYLVYNRVDGVEANYLEEIEKLSPILSNDTELVTKSFEVCEKLKEIERKIEDYYANS